MKLGTSIPIAVLLASHLCAQTGGFTFATQVPNAAPQPIAAGGTIQFPAVSVGSAVAVTLSINSSQPAQWTIASAAAAGSGFAAVAAGTPIPAGATSAFLVTFTPAAAGPSSGTLNLVLAGPSGQTGNFSFNLSATAAAGLLISYVINPNGNQTLVAGGGAITFPQTQLNATAAATITISNQSTSTATLNSAAVLGGAYHAAGLPLLPAQIGANTDLHFTLTFTPVSIGAATGTLTLTINGNPQAISLTGQGAGSVLSFSTVNDSSPTAVNPGDTIALGSAPVGSSQTQITVIARNNGNANAQISGIAVSNSSFGLPGLPALPAAVPPGGSFAFTVAFTPKSAGALTATLSVGTSSFVLTGTGLGPNLTVTLVNGSQRTPIPAGGSATLPNTAVGSKFNFVLEIDNTGNQAGTISSLSVVGNDLSAVQPPAVPATIQPGASLAVNAVFAPTTLGVLNGYLKIGNQTYALTATADPPAPLPAVTFSNVTSQMSPLLQPALGITLAAPYPQDLTGLLSLNFTADVLGDDPNVEFITGTRFVPFRIPANATQAVFGTGASAGNAAPFQTGTAAGVISLSATFALGSYDLTGGNPVTQTITIPESAPVIRAVQIAGESSTEVTLLITGFSTPRSVQSLAFTLTAAPGASLSTSSLSADVSKAFDTWFKSSTGVSFGSQFSISVQLNVNGALSAIGSIAVTAGNSNGTSAPVSIALQ